MKLAELGKKKKKGGDEILQLVDEVLHVKKDNVF